MSKREFIIRLPKKSESMVFPEIIKIANKNNTEIKGNFQFIKFTEASDDLKQLIDLIPPHGAWMKIVELEIDKKKFRGYELKKINEILFCESKDECAGICRKERIEYYISIDDLLNIFNPKIGEREIENKRRFLAQRVKWVIVTETTTTKKYSFEYDAGIEAIKNIFDVELQICPIFNIDKFKDKLKKLSSDIEITKDYDQVIDEAFTDIEHSLKWDLMNFIESFTTDEDEDSLVIPKIIDYVAERIAKNTAIEVEKVLRKVIDEYKKLD